MARGRPREFDRDQALQSAMLVFWRKGYNATSVPDLCEALAIRTPSLYAAFGNKEKLYVEAVELYMKTSQNLLWGYLKEGKDARVSIKNLLMAEAKEMTACDAHPIGCFITLATVDEDMPAAVSTTIRKARADWLKVIHDRIQLAVDDGEISKSTDVNSLSRFFIAIIQSLGIQSHDGATKSELEKVVEVAMRAWP